MAARRAWLASRFAKNAGWHPCVPRLEFKRLLRRARLAKLYAGDKWPVDWLIANIQQAHIGECGPVEIKYAIALVDMTKDGELRLDLRDPAGQGRRARPLATNGHVTEAMWRAVQ